MQNNKNTKLDSGPRDPFGHLAIRSLSQFAHLMIRSFGHSVICSFAHLVARSSEWQTPLSGIRDKSLTS